MKVWNVDQESVHSNNSLYRTHSQKIDHQKCLNSDSHLGTKAPKLSRRRKSASDAYNLATASSFKKPIKASGPTSETKFRIDGELGKRDKPSIRRCF